MFCTLYVHTIRFGCFSFRFSSNISSEHCVNWAWKMPFLHMETTHCCSIQRSTYRFCSLYISCYCTCGRSWIIFTLIFVCSIFSEKEKKVLMGKEKKRQNNSNSNSDRKKNECAWNSSQWPRVSLTTHTDTRKSIKFTFSLGVYCICVLA